MISINRAPLPETYVAALDALRACCKHFTLERYATAALALERCWHEDETGTWPVSESTMATNMRMAADNTLMRLAARVDGLRMDWVRSQAGAA